jgi:DNA polymerase-3 subunit gamma/tau
MSYLVLARKWRPMRFEDLVGQDHVARTLGNAIAQGRVAHAFLFTGVRGVGKTTSARILAKTLNCMGDPATTPPGTDPGPTATPCLKCPACLEIALGTDVDVREIDGASYNGVDEVRKLQDGLFYRPARDRYKIFIVDEVHMLSQNAWNAFLKTLEEPPPHVKFIFATTEVHKVPITILSRVQRFDFKLIAAQQIGARLRYVLTQEKIAADDAAISILSREAAGSMRDAMSLLDQVIAWGGTELRGEEVARVLGVASHRVLQEAARALVTGNAERCLEVVAELANEGHDLAHAARDLLSVLRDLVVAKVAKDSARLIDRPEEEARELRELAEQSSPDDLLRLHHGFAEGYDSVVRSGQPRSALDMLLVRLSRRPPLLAVDALLERLSRLERRLGSPPPRPPTGPGTRPAPSAPPARPAFQGQPREPEGGQRRRPEASDERKEPPEARRSSPPARATSRPAAIEAPDLDEVFRALVGRVAAERPELAAKLEHGVLVEVGANRIVLGWPPESVFGSLVSTPENDAVIERLATELLGMPMRLTHEPESDRAKGRKTLSVLEAEAREQRRKEAYERIRRHPRVEEAVEIFSARVRDLKLSSAS